ncbi:MAG: chemotaxis protein CheC [Oscillospiraceae bacterium]|nr:chemotaxis protein CheC [Oscillospiraceae bacterium]
MVVLIMPINNVEQLGDLHFDVLREIGSIGSGNAASALSGLLNCETSIAVPKVTLLDFNESVNFLGGPENIVIGMLVDIKGDITAMMLYVLQREFADKMASAVFGSNISDILSMNEMETSFISEIGNILGASYINAIAQLTGLAIDISIPYMTIDMAGAILSVPTIHFAQVGDKVLFIDDCFSIGDDAIKSNMILVPEMKSLETLFSKLGVNH